MSMHEISFPAENIFEVFNFPVTNTFLLTLLVGSFIFIIFRFGLKNEKLLPCSFQNTLEWILEKILNFIDSITQNRKKTEEIFPIAATLFIFILFANFLELLPGIGVFSFLRSPSSDLNFTLALGISSMIIIHIFAVKKLGLINYLRKYFHKNPVFSFIGVLEGTSEVTKALSLSIRLFGNLFAGEVLLIVVSSMFAFLLPLPFLFLEILVGFIQALIFSTLIIVFYTTAIQTAQH